MFDRTITLFCYHEKTNMWNATTIPDVTVKNVRSSDLTVNGIKSTDEVKFIIQCDENRKLRTEDGVKKYIEPKAYNHADDISDKITFNPERDFIYIGKWEDTQNISANAYENGLYDAMNREYDNVFLVSSFAVYGLLPHMEVGGK